MIEFIKMQISQDSEPKLLARKKFLGISKLAAIRRMKKAGGTPNWFWYEITKKGFFEAPDDSGNLIRYEIRDTANG